MAESHGIRRIGMLVEHGRAFGRELCEGVITHAQECGDWELVFLDVRDLRSGLGPGRFDGFIARVTSDEIADILARTGKPVVDIYYDRPRHGFAIVKTQHEKIGAMAAEHFMDRRFENFAYCPYGGGRTSVYCNKSFVRRLRRGGFGCRVYVYDGAEEARYDISDTAVIAEKIAPPPDWRVLAKWLRALPKPVAVFCPSDVGAWQTIYVCNKAGLAVPRDVAVLGLDNDLIICGSSRPMLSSIDPNTREIGRVAAETLQELMDSGVPSRSVVRQVPPAGVVSRASTETAPIDPPWLAEALVYVWRNAKNGISAIDVFEHVGRSHTLVARMFREKLGTSVQKEIARMRLNEAQRLLKTTSMSIKRVAAHSGFRSVAYLMQTFTAAFGIPPGEWRERNT